MSSWRISVLVIAFLEMIFTPSDPYSMLLMMMPLIGLYFFGIMLCRWMPRRVSQFGEAIE
jgi:sec-independent protein translocase protein TatC